MLQMFRRHLTAINASPLFRRVVKGAFWSMIGSMISRGLILLSTIGAARLLGTENFGEFSVIQNTVGLFGTFAGFGLGIMATKFVAEYRFTDPPKAGRIIALSNIIAMTTGSVMVVALFFAAPYLAEKTLGSIHLSPMLKIGTGLLFFSSLNELQIGTLSGFEAFKTIAKVNLFGGLAHLPLILGGAYLFGLEGAVWGLTIAMAVNCFLSKLALRKKARIANVPVKRFGCKKEIQIVWRFCVPAMMSSMVAAPVMWACTAVLVNQPNGYTEMGIYSAVNKFQMVVTYAGSILGTALLPILASREAAQNEVFNRCNVIISWALGLLIAIPLICFPEIIERILGGQYTSLQTQRTVILVMCFTIITLYRQGLTRTIIVNEMMWWGLLDNITWAAILCLSFYSLHKLGAVGLAASLLIAYVINTIAFVPFYVSKALVPLGTMLSREAYTIWAIIGLTAFISFQSAEWIFRLFLLAITLLLLYFSFKRLMFSGRTLKNSNSAINGNPA
jgi:O-antigen/teichoic acid export membrane protein